MAVYQVTLSGTLFGQIWSNVFFYCSRSVVNQVIDPSLADISTQASNIAAAFNTQVKPSWAAAMSGDAAFSSIVAKNLFDPTDAATIDLSGQIGTQSASSNPALPAHDAIAFKLETAGRAGRPGQKRFAGVTATNTTDGVVVGAPYIALLNTLATKFDDPLVGGAPANTDYPPVVVKRIQHLIVNGIRRYRLPENAAECIVKLIVAVLWNVFVSTQNSRKQ